MNLKHLVQAQISLISQRRDGTDTLCRQAYALLAESESQGFEDKDLLKEAMRLFIQAIRQQRQNPEPYLGLIYLFFLIGEETQAQQYLAIVLKLDPQHQEAQTLLRFMQVKPETEQVLQLSWEGEQLSPEQIYDKLELSLYYVLQDIRRQDLALAKLNHSAEVLRYLQQLAAWLKQFESGLQQLDMSYDTSSLIRRLQPVENRVSQLKSLLAASESLQKLSHSLNTLLAESRQLYQAVEAQQLTEIEAKLERLLDASDKNAQALSDLVGTGVDLAEVQRSYTALKAIIEQIYETIDC